MRFAHLIFDLDGTLVDSLEDLSAAANHMRQTFGLPALPQDTVRTFIGDGVRALVTRCLDASPLQPDAALPVFMSYYGEHLLDRTRAYPEIESVLQRLHASGVGLSVLSNKPEVLARNLLGGLGLAGYFLAILGGDSLPQRKPHPAGVDWLRARFTIRREAVAMVGDSLIDLSTARAAGIEFLGAGWGFAAGALRSAGVRIITDPGALFDAVA
jgi:phosphoglycolate phosphatase